MAKNGLGSLFGNTVSQKCLESVRWVEHVTDPADMANAIRHVPSFRKYANQYNVDWLLMLAQGFQESKLNQNARSSVGAIGVMQLMPETGRELQVGNIHTAEHNIHAGVKYVRQIIDEHFSDEEIPETQQLLFALAAYNAGPSRISRLRREAKKRGLDPNKWFNNVELVVAEKVGGQPTQYVSNIFKYYLAFSLVQEPEFKRDQNRESEQRELKTDKPKAP
jgi:membrane-bound lytic murein transglycosylase MltF